MNFQQVIEYLPIITSAILAVTGLIGTIGAVAAKVSSPFRRWIISRLEKNDSMRKLESSVEKINDRLANYEAAFKTDREEQKLMKEAYICLTRNALTEIWHKADDDGYIIDWDRENFARMYGSYIALGGNAYMHEVNEKIHQLPSKPPRRTRRTTSRTR